MALTYLVFVVTVALSIVPFGVAEDWIDSRILEMDLEQVVQATLGLDELQAKLDRLRHERDPLDAEIDLEYLKSNLTVRFDRVSTSVRDLKTTIQEQYGSFITTEPDAYPRCCEVTSGVTNWDFKTEILDDKFCYYKSDQSREDSLYPNVDSSLQIITAMRNNHYDSTSDSSIRWQFFGSIDGISLKFPAAADNDACGSFDNRVRPWYVEGATSRYRDNIIVIEITEAMIEPFELMRRVARNVLESLNPNDRIGLVFFNQGAHTPTGDDQSSKCYYSELAYATPQNREYLNNSLNDENLDPLVGSARYVEGISAAFQLFEQTPQIDDQSRDKVIMLFTAASSNVFIPQNVYDHTESLNNEMNDEVTIFTYAFGEEISQLQQQFLETLADQTWSNSPTIKRGDFTHINSSRRYDPGTYYKFASRDSSDITPIFTVPYYDSWGLGMVVSTCLPVHYEDELVGVTCIDLVLADLLGTIDSFVHGEHSYAFVIDATGRTLVHPLLPQIHTVTEDPIILNIRVLERSADDQDDIDFILSEMKSGGSGSRTVSTARIYSLGDSMLHGFEEQQFRSHYHWNAISGHSFSVCLVVVDSDVNLQIDSLSPEDIGNMKFLYHRTDFQQGDERLGETFTYCNDNGQVAVKGRSVVQLAGAAFTDPNFFYNKPTTRNRISKLRNYVLGEDLQGERDGKPIYRPNVRALIQHTTSMDDIWSRKSVYEDFVKLRILSFNNGVTRTFPGSSVNNYFNDKTRPWHRVATAYPGEVTVAAPYPDVLGEDIVITIAQTIYAPKSSGQHTSSDLILGVTAVDLKVGFLYTLVKKYDACLESNQRCLIIDSSGYVVYHDEFLNVDEFSTADRHIVDMEPALASYFIQSGYMVKTTCADFVNVQDAHSWKMRITNLRHFDVGPNVPDFEIQKVGTSNVFLLIIREKSTPESCSCTESTSLPICNDDVTCECPCYAVYDDDEYHYCKNSFVLQSYVDTHTCIPQVNQLPKSIDDPLQVNISTLETCHVVMCAAYTSEKECEIFSANGCSWCTTSDSETKRCLEASLCAEYLPSNDSGLSGGAIAGIVVGLLVLLIVLAAVILFILYRRGIILSGRKDGKSTRATPAPTDQTYPEYEDPPVVQYDYADKSYLESQLNHQIQPTAQVPPPLPSREDDSVQGSGYALQTAPDHRYPSGNASAGFQDSGNHSGGSILHEGTPPSGGCNTPNRGGLYITSPAQAASDDTQLSDVPHKVAENPKPSAPDSSYETPTDHSNTSSTMELDKQRPNYVNKSMSDNDSYGLERTSDIVITEN